jgi:CMP-N-acetylneuraminic acid synthetase
MKYIIPARKGSKGLKNKNRLLFDYTAKIIPAELSNDVYVTTDDEWIIGKSFEYGFNSLIRKPRLAQDDASIKPVLLDLVENYKINDDITMLYLTYPKRTWEDVEKFRDFYIRNGKSPTICKKKIKIHPYLCYYNIGNNKGKKIVNHDLYRRQDYPECFQICHFLFSCKANMLHDLDFNLFSNKTNFYEIHEDKCLDIDTIGDYEKFKDWDGVYKKWKELR